MSKLNKRQPRDLVITEEGAPIGLLTWWRLSGEISLKSVIEAATAQGFDPEECPTHPSEAVALSRAVTDVTTSKDTKRIDKDGAWHIHRVVEVAGAKAKDRMRHDLILIVRLNEEERGGLSFETGDVLHPDCDQYYSDISQRYAHNLRVLSVQDIAQFLARQLRRAQATGMRERGGVYLIPTHTRPIWEAAVQLIEATSSTCRIQEIEVRSTEKLVAEIMDTLSTEAEEFAEKTQQDILDDKLGKRALSTREELLKTMRDKMSSYEQLLGVKLTKMRESLATVERVVTVAMMKVDSQVDEEEPPL